ncbi:MAG: hypothetical protein MJ131_01565 [Lachnospiraceae bacterium]|nr:hypothetical protein [Lachnospiraceae bacterium]
MDNFERALYRLDELLVETNHESIEIRALGGFAMMYYGVRENGYTIDIDSLTPDYDSKVLELIKQVGAELNMEYDWLNTDVSMLDGFLNILANKITWNKSEYTFKRINLLVADMIGLLQSKVKAVNDGGIVPRITDKKDLVSILKKISVNDIYELNANDKCRFIETDYPRCYEYLTVIGSW